MSSYRNLDATLSSLDDTPCEIDPSSLKGSHFSRPLYVLSNGLIIFDVPSVASSKSLYNRVYDFLVTISDPVCRPAYSHQYQLTPFSLYAASAVNYTSEGIISTLNKLSKSPIPANVSHFIKTTTSRYGKVKLLLKGGNVYIEARDNEQGKEILRIFINNPDIAKCRLIRRERDISGFDEPGEYGGDDKMFIKSNVDKEDEGNTREFEIDVSAARRASFCLLVCVRAEQRAAAPSASLSGATIRPSREL